MELSASWRCLTAWQDDHTAVETLLEGLRVESDECLCTEEAEAALQVRQITPCCYGNLSIFQCKASCLLHALGLP